MFSPKSLLAPLILLFFLLQATGALGLPGWSTDADWATGTFSNTTSMGGVLQVTRNFYREYEPTGNTSAWWHLNGDASDASGNGNAGALGNSSAWTVPVWNSSGRFGGALDFFNDSRFVNVSNSFYLNSSVNLTVEAWVNLNSSSRGNSTVLGKEGSYHLMAYNASTGNATGFWINIGGSSWVNALAPDDLRGTGWRFLAGTYDGAYVRFYIDGVLKTTTPATGQMANNKNNLFIGSYNNGTSGFFNGTIDEVRIVNRSLTQEELALDYAGHFRSASYLSSTITAFDRAILSVTPLISKTEHGFNGALNLTNLTVELSVNNGTTWRSASNNVTLDTSADNGTSLSFRVNFTTNDTRFGASLSSLVVLALGMQNRPPNVTLVSPLNGYSAANDDVGLAFSCSAADDAELASISLWHNMTGIWRQNATAAVNGTYNATTFAANGTFGNFTWNCMATDSAGQSSFAPGNFSLSLKFTPVPPSIGISFSPATATISVEAGQNGTVTASVTNSATSAIMAGNVSLSFTDSPCCTFSYLPLTLDVPQLESRNFTITVSVLEGATPTAQFSTVVTALSQEGAAASAPLTISVLAKTTASPTPVPTTPTATPVPTPDPKLLAESAADEANSTILSVDIAIAAAERERKDVRLAVSRLAEARGLLKTAYSLMSGEAIDYAGAQKAAKDATSRAKEALAAIPEKGRSALADLWIIVPIMVIVVAIGFIAYNTFFGPKRKAPIPTAYQPTQQQYYQYYRSYPYYYRPQQPSPQQQQQPRKPY